MTVYVTGFGAFPGVPINPTEALALALNGRQIGDADIVGEVLPVSYRRGPDQAIARARELDAKLVIGLGVATKRSRVCVERQAVCVEEGKPDIDDQTITGLVGPATVAATAAVSTLAAALGAQVSHNAGRYVCNAWLYRVSQALDVPVAFVHVPATGLSAELLLSALSRIVP